MTENSLFFTIRNCGEPVTFRGKEDVIGVQLNPDALVITENGEEMYGILHEDVPALIAALQRQSHSAKSLANARSQLQAAEDGWNSKWYEQAKSEGWCLLSTDDPVIPFQLQRFDEAGFFDNDEALHRWLNRRWLLVGDECARGTVRLLARWSPVEFDRVRYADALEAPNELAAKMGYTRDA